MSVPLAPPENPWRVQCRGQCSALRAACDQVCVNDQRGCWTAMREQAYRDYELYAQEQQRAHQPQDLTASDFERPLRCSAASCEKACDLRHQSCYEVCGDLVPTKTDL